MSRRRVLAFCLALGVSALLALPALAAARSAYVTAGQISSGFVAPVDLSTGTFGSSIPFMSEGAPQDVAITPNGSTAYVTGPAGIVPIDVATNTPEPEISTGIQTCPNSLAITPDGSRLYATDPCEGNVAGIDIATGAEVLNIPTGGAIPTGIAITTDGTRAYVVDVVEETVTPIVLATSTVGTPFPVGSSPQGIAVTPDGSRAYVALFGEDAIKRIDLATDTVGPPIPVSDEPEEIMTSPDSSRAYVTSFNDFVTPVDLNTDTAGTAIAFAGEYLGDVSIMPDGSRAWVTDTEPGEELASIEIPANTLGPAIAAPGRPDAIAIVPNQGPRAAFISAPNPVLRGDTINFDGTGSTDSDGTVARYVWDFGDGGDPVVAGANPQHTYSFGGTYTVTLTVTDNEGCSLVVVFPGQTAHCNGSSLARVSHQVQVTPKCIEVNGSASSFVPKYRAARVVPGVRLRLAASDPARLTVDATLSWSRGGGGSFEFKQLVTNVQHWRRTRFVIPSELRSELPLGTAVKLKLQIEAAPLDETLCPGKTVKKTLRLRVVKVIPGVVQAGRPR